MSARAVQHPRRRRWRFGLDSPADLADLADELSLTVPTSDDLSVLARPLTVGGLTVPNRLVVQPMEGCDGDGDGRPGELTVRRYERFAAGGAGLLWMEAMAVTPEGRANPRQLQLTSASTPAMAGLLDRVRDIAASRFGREHRPMLIAQLTHSGRYSRPEGRPAALMATCHPGRDAGLELPRDGYIVSDDYLDSLVDRYAAAAVVAIEAGFDALDVKACHGYLLGELLGAHTREGRYGGSFEDRTRLMLAIIERLARDHPDTPIVTRLNVYDAVEYPYGWGVDHDDPSRPDLREPKRLIELLAERGVRIVNVTVGNPYYKPHVNRPYNEPVVDAADAPEHPLAGVARLIDLAGQIQQHAPDLPVVGSGYSWLRTLLPAVAAAAVRDGRATLIGCGRMALAYPQFAADILEKGRLDPDKVCISCSGCTQLMRDGQTAGCVVRDHDVYGPIFRRGRLSNRENLHHLAESCRACDDATCVRGCPAEVDIPGFIGRFLDDDDRGAYDLLRERNIFPLVCAELCPVQQQCQGHCLQNYLGQRALPISDIQRFLSTTAIRQGWAGLTIPPKPSGCRVAVIGGGPAGLACAAMLLEAGHTVTIFDTSDLGGLIRSAIPPERVAGSLAEEIAATFAHVPPERLIVRREGLSAERDLDAILAEGHDAAFVGLGLSRAVGLPGAKPEGVLDALTFLAQARRGEVDLADRRVAVIGGGNTAVDAALTAVRMDAREVSILYRRSFNEMPAWSTERDEALAGGVHIRILTAALGYDSADGRVQAVRVCPTVLGEPDASGRRRPMPQEQSTYTIDVDVVIEAVGQQAPPELAQWLNGVTMTDGLIDVGGDQQTTRDGVYAGGDVVRGPDTVVAAIADGMAAAQGINKRLSA